MDELMKEQIILDTLQNERHKLENGYCMDLTRYVIKLVRSLDNYRERDNKGRFIKAGGNNS